MATTRSERDPVGRLFAQLTAKLEDACVLATDGQNSRLTPRRRKALLRRILRIVAEAQKLIADCLDDGSTNTGGVNEAAS